MPLMRYIRAHTALYKQLTECCWVGKVWVWISSIGGGISTGTKSSTSHSSSSNSTATAAQRSLGLTATDGDLLAMTLSSSCPHDNCWCYRQRSTYNIPS